MLKQNLARLTLFLVAVAMGVLVVAFMQSAYAWDKQKKAKPTQQQEQRSNQRQDQTVDASSSSSASAGSENNISIDGGSTGDMVSLNSSQFYALSLMFPNAIDCFSGIQGGAQDSDVNSGTSGFLGLHMLNKSCWLQKQASAERDIEINARLRCGDRHYRNAVAYDAPRRDRRERCIQMKVDSAQAEMREYRNMVIEQEKVQQKLAECHARIDDANERTVRCTEQFIEDQSK